MLKKLLSCCIIILLTAPVAGALASSSYDNVYKEYPKDTYLVGIGETGRSGNLLNDKRVAEVLARLEIAKQIKVRMKEETLDIMCEGGSARLFKDILQCKNQFIMIVEVTVDEFLQGSRIVNHGENGDIVFAVAVMPKEKAVEELNDKVKASVDNTKEIIAKAQKGDKSAAKEAREEYMKAVTYDKERELIDGVKNRASGMFDDLEKELVKLREKNEE